MNYKAGLKENWKQFFLLVCITAFVGGMVGMERSILPQLAEEEFGLTSHSIILSFIVAFGISKAIANYFTGKLADHLGRKNILILGWVIALPIPFMIMYAPEWNWIVAANVLLGISQGMTWSSTVVMKMDLVGDKDRGLAMGINEFAGYLAIGLIAYATGYIADQYGIRPYPFYIGIVLSMIGLSCSIFLVRDTQSFVTDQSKGSSIKMMSHVFLDTTVRHKTLSAVTQAGLVNNLNDGMIWGLLPILLLGLKFNNQDIGIISGIYPFVWGLAQLYTGKLSDVFSKKRLLFIGMFMQGIAILLLPLFKDFYTIFIISACLGLGTAFVYPTFLATIAQYTHPSQRAESVGVFRFWRDLGYAIGAWTSGLLADRYGIQYAIIMIGSVTVISALIIQIRMPKDQLS